MIEIGADCLCAERSDSRPTTSKIDRQLIIARRVEHFGTHRPEFPVPDAGMRPPGGRAESALVGRGGVIGGQEQPFPRGVRRVGQSEPPDSSGFLDWSHRLPSGVTNTAGSGLLPCGFHQGRSRRYLRNRTPLARDGTARSAGRAICTAVDTDVDKAIEEIMAYLARCIASRASASTGTGVRRHADAVRRIWCWCARQRIVGLTRRGGGRHGGIYLRPRRGNVYSWLLHVWPETAKGYAASDDARFTEASIVG